MTPFSFGEEPLEANEFVMVTCSVMKGDFPLSITWTFNNKTLKSGGDLSISQTGKRTSTLAIESVKGHHAGTYSCIGRNEAGYDVHSSDLIVNGSFALFQQCIACGEFCSHQKVQYHFQPLKPFTLQVSLHFTHILTPHPPSSDYSLKKTQAHLRVHLGYYKHTIFIRPNL